MRALLIVLLLIPAQAASAGPRTPRVAVIYSDYRAAERDMLSAANKDLNWLVDSWNMRDMHRMASCIDQYDILVFGSCYNYTPGYELRPDGTCELMVSADVLRGWVEAGGVIAHAGVGDDRAGDAWFRSIKSDLTFSYGKCQFEENSDWFNEETPLQVGPRATGWCHFAKIGPGWTEMNRCFHGNTINAWSSVGKGFVVASIHVSTSGVTFDDRNPKGGSTLRTYWAHAMKTMFPSGVVRIESLELPDGIGLGEVVVGVSNAGTEAAEITFTARSASLQSQTASETLSVGPGESAQQALPFLLTEEGQHLITVDVEDADGQLLDRQRVSIVAPEVGETLTDLKQRAERNVDALAEVVARSPVAASSMTVLTAALRYADEGIRGLPTEATLETLAELKASALAEVTALGDVEDRLGAWGQLNDSRGTRFAVSSLSMSDKLVRRDIKLRGQLQRLDLSGCRGEYVGAQIAVVPFHARLRNVNVTIGDLRRGQATIPAGASKARPVAFLQSEGDAWFAELVRNKQEFTVATNEAARQVWITVRVPDDAEPGTYRGKLTVATPTETQEFPLSLRVWDFDMPFTKHLPTDFSFRPNQMQALFNTAHWYEQGWRELVTREQYERWSRWIGEYRIQPTPYDESRNPIDGFGPSQTSQPWLHAEWEGDELVIDWEGFDWTVELLRSMGYTTFRAGYTAGTIWDPDENTVPENEVHYRTKGRFWRSFLPQIEAHLATKDWDDVTFYWYQKDEVQKHAYEGFVKVAGELKTLAPSVKRLTVLQTPLPPALNESTDIWIPSMGALSQAQAAVPGLKAEGDWVGGYVCTSPSPPFSELMMREPGLNHRLLPWICRKVEVDLLLYYGLNFWCYQWRPFETNIDQIDDDGHFYDTWPRMGGGGGVLFYPGGKSIEDEPQASLRLELLRQGMQDYEYFWMLDELTRGRDDEAAVNARALLEVPAEIVPGFTGYTDDESLVETHKRKIAEAIEVLDYAGKLEDDDGRPRL